MKALRNTRFGDAPLLAVKCRTVNLSVLFLNFNFLVEIWGYGWVAIYCRGEVGTGAIVIVNEKAG